jgi:hypothetical protein
MSAHGFFESQPIFAYGLSSEEETTEEQLRPLYRGISSLEEAERIIIRLCSRDFSFSATHETDTLSLAPPPNVSISSIP